MDKLQGVYFIKSTITNLIKIGCTSDLESRLNTLQNISSEKLFLIGFIKTEITNSQYQIELDYHKKFYKFRHHGEWFESNEIIIKEIKTNINTQDMYLLNKILDKIYTKELNMSMIGDNIITNQIYDLIKIQNKLSILDISNNLNLYESIVKIHITKLKNLKLISCNGKYCKIIK